MLADKIALMIDGKIVQYGASQTVYTKPRTKRVAEFFGWANFVPANKKGKVVSSCFGDFLFDDLDQEDGDLLLTIRPEAAAVCGKDEGFQAVVRSSVYVGTKINYLVDCLGESLSITLDTNHVFEKGDILFLKFNGDKVWAVPPCPRKQVEKTTRPVDSQVSN
jgi:ABC-type Fe3+/spermidine/putrescine transport system ATPase subunit